MKTKFLFNAGLSLVVAVVMSFLTMDYIDGWTWITYIKGCLIIFISYFLLGLLYGDDDHNITNEWPKRLNKIKDIIGTFLAFAFLAMMACFILALINIWTMKTPGINH